MNTLNNVTTSACLIACVTIGVALLVGGKNTAPKISQIMEPIVVTAKRLQVIRLATIEVTAKRLVPATAAQTIALAPMVIITKRIQA